MEAAGGEVAKHYKDLAFMGFAEVVMNLRTILNNFSYCKEDILKFRPDALILIDYPGFNLRIAKWAKKKGIKVFYYISPQIWAWNSSRVHQIRRDIDRMFCILPFEKAFYEKYGLEVDFVGHPLLDVINRKQSKAIDFYKKYNLPDKPVIGLLPGSRTQEIKTSLPVMLKPVKQFPDYQFVVAGAPGQTKASYQSVFEKENIAVPIIENKTYELLEHATCAFVTSGTATLETALYGVPEIVCYKGNPISYQIAKRVINVKYISLVNLICEREIVPELIQNEFSPENLAIWLDKILNRGEGERMKKDFRQLRNILGNSGASERTAKLILKSISI